MDKHISLRHFPNKRRQFAGRCSDCWWPLLKGEGCMQVRGEGRFACKRLVCRDRAECARQKEV